VSYNKYILFSFAEIVKDNYRYSCSLNLFVILGIFSRTFKVIIYIKNNYIYMVTKLR